MVLLSSCDLPLELKSCMLSPHEVGHFKILKIGHFKILKILNTSAVKLQLPKSMKIHPTVPIFLLKPVSSSELS